MQALAVVGESHQGPLALDLLEAAQREPGEAEHRLDDAEDRLDGLPAKLVGGTAEASTLTRPTRNSFNSLASSRTCKKLSDTAAKFSRRKRAIVSWSG